MGGFFESLLALFMDLLGSVLTLAGDVLIFVFDMLITAILGVIGLLLTPFSGDIQTVVSSMNVIPPAAWDLAYRCGLKEASAIVASALMLKFVLNLIPFVGLGRK